MTAAERPEDIGLFPLTGVLLLPGMRLPLHVFEPRYRALVEDALEGNRHFGMIQPFVPRQDNRPAPGVEGEVPELYGVGCLGRISRCERSAEGRFALTLVGVSRFTVQEELPLQRGYRRARVSYEDYRDDLLEPEENFNAAALVEAVDSYARAQQMQLDITRFATLPGIALLNGLCMSLPFGPAEKQALLEAPTTADREQLLRSLLAMGHDAATDVPEQGPPVLN